MKGNRIKLLREEKKIRQDELAKVLSISPSAVGMYERDEREPNDEITLKLAEYFGVSTDYLLGKSDMRNPEKAQDDPLGLAKIGFSMKDYNPPTDKQREQLAELIKVVLKDNKKEDKEKNENNKG